MDWFDAVVGPLIVALLIGIGGLVWKFRISPEALAGRAEKKRVAKAEAEAKAREEKREREERERYEAHREFVDRLPGDDYRARMVSWAMLKAGRCPNCNTQGHLLGWGRDKPKCWRCDWTLEFPKPPG